MEELRPCLADRFVLSLINNRVLQAGDFEHTDSGAVLLTDAGRKKFLQAWAGAQTRDDHASLLKREARMGSCAICAGAAAGAVSAGRSGRVSAVLVEVRAFL